MKYVVIIPSRMASSRFPGKPLKKINGMTMLQHCFERVKLSVNKENIYISSCDKEIEDLCHIIDSKFIKTSKKCKSATERTFEAFKKIEKKNNKKINNIVMVQGDEPLLDILSIKKSIKKIEQKNTSIINVLSRPYLLSQVKNKNNVKAVVNKKKEIIYFSRESIPSNWKKNALNFNYIQTGIITFSREALFNYFKFKNSYLEDCESVDMNRFIENGIKIGSVIIDHFTFGVDTKKDLQYASLLMKKDKHSKVYLK